MLGAQFTRVQQLNTIFRLRLGWKRTQILCVGWASQAGWLLALAHTLADANLAKKCRAMHRGADAAAGEPGERGERAVIVWTKTRPEPGQMGTGTREPLCPAPAPRIPRLSLSFCPSPDGSGDLFKHLQRTPKAGDAVKSPWSQWPQAQWWPLLS